MTASVYVAMVGWPLVSVAFFAWMPPRRAVIASFLGAWLFLPVARFPLPGLPDYTKMLATGLGVLLGVAIFDVDRLVRFRPRWFDLPMAIWCASPLASSLSNDLGVYDGGSALLVQTLTWGLPYFVGRLYFSDLEGLRELALGFLVGGVLYVPLCLLELRMSPQLHRWLYGFHQHSFAQTVRFGGWRPTVFMEHGLMVGMWMSMAALLGIWLWGTGSLRQSWRFSPAWVALPLLVTAVLCKSMGALVLLGTGLLVLWLAWKFRTRGFLIALAAVSPLYLSLRVTGAWSGQGLVEAAASVSAERAGSLQVRLRNEDLLMERALRKPWFGWAGWGRARVRDEEGRDVAVTDGLWIIELGNHGLFGLLAMLATFLSPAVWLLRRAPPSVWSRPALAPAAGLAVVATLYLVDCVPNGMVNPMFVLGIGGVTALATLVVKVRRPDERLRPTAP